MFKDMGNGYHMTFSNGYTISVTWRAGTYSDNYRRTLGIAQLQSKTAEVWGWKGGVDQYGNPTNAPIWDDPFKYQTPEQVAEHIQYVSQLEA